MQFSGVIPKALILLSGPHGEAHDTGGSERDSRRVARTDAMQTTLAGEYDLSGARLPASLANRAGTSTVGNSSAAALVKSMAVTQSTPTPDSTMEREVRP